MKKDEGEGMKEQPATLDYAGGVSRSYVLRREGEVLRVQVFRDRPAGGRQLSRLRRVFWILFGVPVGIGAIAVLLKGVAEGDGACVLAALLMVAVTAVFVGVARWADRRRQAEPVAELVISPAGVVADRATWKTLSSPKAFRSGPRASLVYVPDQFIPSQAVQRVEFVAAGDLPDIPGVEGGWLRIGSAMAEASLFLSASRGDGEAVADEVDTALGRKRGQASPQ